MALETGYNKWFAVYPVGALKFRYLYGTYIVDYLIEAEDNDNYIH